MHSGEAHQSITLSSLQWVIKTRQPGIQGLKFKIQVGNGDTWSYFGTFTIRDDFASLNGFQWFGFTVILYLEGTFRFNSFIFYLKNKSSSNS